VADNPKLEIEIVLADGTVQKAFGKIVADAGDAGKKIEKNLSVGFGDALAQQSAIALGPLSRFVSLSGTAAIALGAIAAAAAAAGGAISLAFQGEKLVKIQQQFENIATSFGIAGQQLADSLKAALNSSIDQEDALKAVTNSIIALNGNASRTAELFKIAQQAANQFGGDAIDTYSNLVRAITTGNTKTLQLIGLQVDLQKAQKDYAASIGATNRGLTENEKIQANLNAILGVAENRYRGITSEAKGLSGALASLKNALGDSFEELALAVNRSIGPTIESAIKSITALVRSFSGTGGDSLSARIKETSDRLLELQNIQAKGFDPAASSAQLAQFGNLSNEIRKTKAELEALLNLEKQRGSDAFRQVLSANVSEGLRLEAEQQERLRLAEEARLKELPKLVALENQIQAERISNLQKLSATTEDVYQKQFLDAQIVSQQILQVELATNAQRAEAQRLFNAGVITSQLDLTNILKEIAQSRADQIATIEQEAAKRRKAEAEALARELAAQNAFIANSTAQAISATIAALARAFTQGGNVFRNFGKAFLGIIGNLATTLGQFVIGAAIAFSALKKSIAGAPFLAIAAGSALIALGAILTAASQGDSGGGTQSVTALSGPGIGGPALVTDDVSPEVQNLRPNDAQTQITVNVEGSILTDNDELGLRIVQVINDAFDRQGLTIRQGAVV